LDKQIAIACDLKELTQYRTAAIFGIKNLTFECEESAQSLLCKQLDKLVLIFGDIHNPVEFTE
jgi:hypothetical protein